MTPSDRPDRAHRSDRAAADALLAATVSAHVGTGAVDPAIVRVGRLCPRCGSAGHGRPHARVDGRRVEVALARSRGVLLAAATDHAPLGVDLEVWDGDPPADRADAVLHVHEHADGPAALVRTWVRKEALLKALGLGLAVDPRAVRLSLPDEAPALHAWHGPGPTPTVTLRDLDLDLDLADVPDHTGHAACLAVLAPATEEAPRVTLRWAAPGGPPRPATPSAGR